MTESSGHPSDPLGPVGSTPSPAPPHPLGCGPGGTLQDTPQDPIQVFSSSLHVAGVAQGHMVVQLLSYRASENSPQSLTVLAQHLAGLVCPLGNLLNLLEQLGSDKGVTTYGDPITDEPWAENPTNNHTST